MTKIAPSILSADFANLIKDVNDVKAGGADWLHFDVMDGIFVPNISIGIPVLKSLRKATDMFLDVHLMIDRPHRYAGEFCDAGADMLVFHVEADQPQNILTAINDVKAKGKLVGLSLKPKTPAEVILPYLPSLDMVLVMTVEPGFGGQSFMHDQLEKIKTIHKAIKSGGHICYLEVDGGIDEETAPLVTAAGANVLVAGSAVFGKSDRKTAIDSIRV
jgi:ribulose-phosphate 3-epimerase